MDTYRSTLKRRVKADTHDYAAHHQLAALNRRHGVKLDGLDWDWIEVLKYGDGFNHENVVYVVAKYEGENDGPDWEMVGSLDDGRWFHCQAWCDYTGWG